MFSARPPVVSYCLKVGCTFRRDAGRSLTELMQASGLHHNSRGFGGPLSTTVIVPNTLSQVKVGS